MIQNLDEGLCVCGGGVDVLSHSVMSDSVRPHRRQPTRLPRPWDSPGKNTGVGCHFLLQCRKVKCESEVARSCGTLSDPMDCSLPGSFVHRIFQARALKWGAIAFSGPGSLPEYKSLPVNFALILAMMFISKAIGIERKHQTQRTLVLFPHPSHLLIVLLLLLLLTIEKQLLPIRIIYDACCNRALKVSFLDLLNQIWKG